MRLLKKVEKTCHCEELQATKQSSIAQYIDIWIASLRSQFPTQPRLHHNKRIVSACDRECIINLWHEFERHCHNKVDSQFEITPVQHHVLFS